tara:strand:+ start:3103 stop:3477 length:375 start_codon:yes stop_codon:yes gene_type:complete
MKSLFTVCLFLLLGQLGFAQNNDKWTSFSDKKSELTGFKNLKGEVMIEPKFMGFTIAKVFDVIIAVMEEDSGTFKTYYLIKSGKKIGNDSLHIFDNGADCENEGFIRFRDKKTDKVGMFDEHRN